MSGAKTNRRRICLGAFAGAHGVKGAAKVKTFTAEPGAVAAYGPVASEDGARRFTLKIIRVLKPDLVLVSAPEIASREDAAALKGVKLYVPRAVLPDAGEDEFYLDDLVGLAAVDETGKALGEVVAAHNFGASDVIELANVPGAKGAVMLPFAKNVFLEIDLAGARIVLARAAIDDLAQGGDPLAREEDA